MYIHVSAGEQPQAFTDPRNSSIISAEIGDTNITTLRCDIFAAATMTHNSSNSTTMQVVTSWQLEDYNGQMGRRAVSTVDRDDAILIHGNRTPVGSFYSSYNNFLTILRFIPELNGTVLSCGVGDTVYLGMFPFLAYSESVLLEECCLKYLCPENLCPENLCPDNLCPENLCPDNLCPENLCPDNLCPDNLCPEYMCPENVCPDNLCPEYLCPENLCPESNAKHSLGEVS
jgi:hypothetical protein